jgi:hypothetical protein
MRRLRVRIQRGWNTRGKSVKDQPKPKAQNAKEVSKSKKVKNQKLGWDPIAIHTIKAQFKPNCQAQSELGPRHIQSPVTIQAPATSKLQYTVEPSTCTRRAVSSSRAHGWVVHPHETSVTFLNPFIYLFYLFIHLFIYYNI